MKQYLLIILHFGLLLFFISCKPNMDTPQPSSGSADFTKFIAIGNSLTAGFADGGLYLEGQKVAFPNLLAEQMKTAGGGEFISPFFNETHANGSGYLRLAAIENGSPVLLNVTDNLAYRDQEEYLIKYTDPIHNLGVPEMRLDLAFYPPFSAVNIYFERLLSNEEVGQKTYFEYAIEKEHTFFSLWLGNNDVLGYAKGGGVITPQNISTTQLTDKDSFSVLYNDFINKLTTNNQKGVIATIPDITDIPFFNTVTIKTLLEKVRTIDPAANDIYVQDKTATVPTFPVGVRPAINEDLVVLTFPISELGVLNSQGFPYGLHPLNPIRDQYILDKSEVAIIKDYTVSYNSSIREVAERKGLALADVYSYLNKVKDIGVLINGAEVTAIFISGGAFSLDGIHLTPKGNALITNLFIQAINKQYNSNLPEVDVNKYRGVKFP